MATKVKKALTKAQVQAAARRQSKNYHSVSDEQAYALVLAGFRVVSPSRGLRVLSF